MNTGSLTPRNSIGSFRLNKLQELEKINAELSERNERYERLCGQLQRDVESLKFKLNKQTESFETDEEELQQEIGRFDSQPPNSSENCNSAVASPYEWQTVRRNKRANESPEHVINNNTKKQATTQKYWLSKTPQTANQYADLDNDDGSQPNSNPPQILYKPPPIFVEKVANIQPLISMLKQTVPNQFEIKTLRNEQVKIMPKDHETYKKIIGELEKKNTEFFTYKPKSERGFKVILRNMHSTANIDDLKNELSQLGHEVKNIWNIRSRYTKVPLPLFEVELSTKPNNKDIYSVTKLMSCVIRFEPPRPKKIVPQCSNCQQYGHTKSYCKKKSVCIKCAGHHESKSCERKNWADEVKCALCNGNHPANYKGCSIYKQIYSQHYPSLRNTRESQQPETRTLTTNPTYSSAARRTDFPQTSQQNTQIQPQNLQTDRSPQVSEIHEMLSNLGTLMQQMTSLLMSLTSKLTQI